MRFLAVLFCVASTAQASVTTLASIASDSPLVALNAAITPDIATGDVMTCDDVTTPGAFAVSVTTAGVFSYVGNDSRQFIHCTFFDTSAGAPHADDLDLWINNLAPLVPDPGSVSFFVPLNSPMTPVDLTPYCSDPEGDLFTVTNITVLPTGLSIVGNVLQGSALSQGIFPDLQFQCTDITGAASIWQ